MWLADHIFWRQDRQFEKREPESTPVREADSRHEKGGRGDKRPKRDNWNQKTSKGAKNTALLVSQKRADLKVKAEKEARGKRGTFGSGSDRGDQKRIIDAKRKEKRFKRSKQ